MKFQIRPILSVQMVSLVSVHGRGSLFDIYIYIHNQDMYYIASLTLLLCQLDSRVSTLVLSMYPEADFD